VFTCTSLLFSIWHCNHATLEFHHWLNPFYPFICF
jgi:hypothetical protein